MSKLARTMWLAALGLVLVLPVSASAAIPDLGDAADFAILAMPDGSDEPFVRLFASAKVTGDIGVGIDGEIDTSASGPGKGIFGDVYLEDGVTNNIAGTTNVTGTVFLGADLSQAIADALAASAAADALVATQTFGTINDDATITRTATENVIDISTIDLGGLEVLTLNGNPTDFFIINIATDFDMTGSSRILLSGGLPPGHVLFNFADPGSDVHMSAATAATGTFLAPHRDAHWDGKLVSGAIYANDVRLGSSGELFHIPFGGEDTPPPPPPQDPIVPEPASGLLLGLGLLGARAFTRRSRSS